MNSNSKARPMNVIKTRPKLLILQINPLLLLAGDSLAAPKKVANL
jgi:hypothetical protein